MGFKHSLLALSVLAATAVASPYTAGAPTKRGGGPDSCQSYEFWYSPKSCCLPHGGYKAPPPPPKGKSCPPTTWYWHPENSCCVPIHPPPVHSPPPQCSYGWDWNQSIQCCEPHHNPPPPPPKPSNTPPGHGGNPGHGGYPGQGHGYPKRSGPDTRDEY